jgi:hypothetical protein
LPDHQVLPEVPGSWILSLNKSWYNTFISPVLKRKNADASMMLAIFMSVMEALNDAKPGISRTNGRTCMKLASCVTHIRNHQLAYQTVLYFSFSNCKNMLFHTSQKKILQLPFA